MSFLIAFCDLILSIFVGFFQTCKHAVCDLLTCEIRPISEQVTLTVAFHLLINPRTWIDLQVGQHLYTSLCICFSIIYLVKFFFSFFFLKPGSLRNVFSSYLCYKSRFVIQGNDPFCVRGLGLSIRHHIFSFFQIYRELFRIKKTHSTPIVIHNKHIHKQRKLLS